MAPERKKRRLSLDGEAAVTTVSNTTVSNDQPGASSEAQSEIKTASASEAAEKETKQIKQHRRQLFVRALPATSTSADLIDFFSEFYPVKHATAVTDPATKQCKGYGFVTFADAEDAQLAQKETDGKLFQGRRIKVETAEPRHRDADSSAGVDGHAKSKASAAAAEAKAKRQKEEVEARQPPKLIVRNMPWSITEPEQLAVLFRSYGKVKYVTIPKKKPGLMSGFGFVVMRGRKNAEKALEAVNGREVDGRTLAVDWAVEKEVWQDLQPTHPEEGLDGEVVHGGVDDEDDPDRAEQDDVGSPSRQENEGEDEDEDFGREDEVEELDDDVETPPPDSIQDTSSTLFLRNIPFSATDETLHGHFSQFGPVRYARIVMDHVTGRPKGTGFVCFYNVPDAEACLREAPRLQQAPANTTKKSNPSAPLVKHSVLENELADAGGQYTLDGRVLQLSRAVGRNEAVKLTEEGTSKRDRRDRDKRRLYLLSEGTVSADSPLYHALPPSEVKMREASAKQRKTLVQTNPSLHLSLTRLSVRNLPRHVTSKDLKALAREAVVGFAKDAKARKRQQLSKEEENRGGEEMKMAERARKAKGKGIVKQAKIVFEGREGSKVAEESGAGRSRGYGFIEYSSHRWALMGLRWLNGHAIGPSAGDSAERKKRLIVEFAIENAQVVARRKEREEKARERSKEVTKQREGGLMPRPVKRPLRKDTVMARTRRGSEGGAAGGRAGRKRKRDEGGGRDGSVTSASPAAAPGGRAGGASQAAPATGSDRLANRQKIIAKKRMQRRSKKRGAGGAG
ncbi:MAG: RNA recognition motif-containing protein [Thelocarpon impressellum]|nr:MAG: RNA recognition motif-containing protein [Thelocarpon impressellum]